MVQFSFHSLQKQPNCLMLFAFQKKKDRDKQTFNAIQAGCIENRQLRYVFKIHPKSDLSRFAVGIKPND